MKEYLTKFEKGKYAIGDLCYIIRDSELWDKVCDKYFSREFKGKFDIPELPEMWEHHTFWGDGFYPLIQKGKTIQCLPVDSGTMGIIKIDDKFNDLLLDEKLEIGSENIILEFEKNFDVYYENGIFYIDDLTILTND